MYAEGSICPVCGAGELERKTVEEQFSYKGEALTVPDYVVFECASCGEAVIDPASSKRASKLLKDFSRIVDGLLTTADIKRIRKKLGFTQEQMAEVCGGGLKGFARYESGQIVQSKGMDNLLRILDELPSALDIIRRRPALPRARIISMFEYKRKSDYNYSEHSQDGACSDNVKCSMG